MVFFCSTFLCLILVILESSSVVQSCVTKSKIAVSKANFLSEARCFQQKVRQSELRRCSNMVMMPTRTRRVKRIIGGQRAQIKYFPWQASVSFNRSLGPRYDEVFCGAAVIGATYVLTAAHCFEQLGEAGAAALQVFVGDSYRNRGLVRRVLRLLRHPNFSSANKLNDIAVLQLASAIPFNKKISPVCLPDDDNDEIYGDHCFISGWGLTMPPPEFHMAITPSYQLKYAVMSPVDRDECVSVWKELNSTQGHQHVCFKEWSGRPCLGDSGSPIVCYSKRTPTRLFLAGLSSFGSFNCGAYVPEVFTRVLSHLRWIDEQIRN